MLRVVFLARVSGVGAGSGDVTAGAVNHRRQGGSTPSRRLKMLQESPPEKVPGYDESLLTANDEPAQLRLI